jgi:hypothetical protein
MIKVDVIKFEMYKTDKYYSGHGVPQTEEFSGYKIFEKGDKLTHFSDKKIKKFVSGQTCFFEGDRTGTGHKYVYTFKEKRKCRIFADQEIRKILEEGDFLEYAGYWERYKTGCQVRSNRTGRMVDEIDFRKC